jgi:hypothetical protein
MIRTGEQFAPYPVDVLDNTQNPLVDQSAVEFVSWSDPNSDDYNITRLERRPAAPYTVGATTYELRGPFVLWVMTYKYDIDGMTMEEQPLLDGVDDVTFTLEYAVGPRLRRATMDLSVRTNSDVTYDVGGNEGKVKHTIGMIEEAPPVRLVASVTPRRLD